MPGGGHFCGVWALEQEDGDDEDPFGQYAEDDTCAARGRQAAASEENS